MFSMSLKYARLGAGVNFGSAEPLGKLKALSLSKGSPKSPPLHSNWQPDETARFFAFAQNDRRFI